MSTEPDPTPPGDSEPGGAAPESEEAKAARRGRLARSTALFSIATSLSRVAGLVREIIAAAYFGVSGAMSAFTVAFLVPNLVRSLFADAAIQAAFVPVFTEQLERGERREAFRTASTMIFLVALVLGAMTALFILIAPLVIPLFVPGFDDQPALQDLTVALSRILFPILVLLGITGMVVGVLNSYERFGAFAISPFFWNLAIIAVLVGLAPAFPEDDQIYAYAIGVLVGTVIQLMIPAWDLRKTPFRLRRHLDWRSPAVKRILLLMLPVTISLGLINFNLVINALFGSLVFDPSDPNPCVASTAMPCLSEAAPAAIDKAFRIYMLPQGIFSVAVATVIFPTLARFAARREFDELRATMANGMRQILVLLIPATAAILVLSEPMIRLVYERGEFNAGQTEIVATALFWFAFSLPFNGLFLLLTRTFFSLQKPWLPTVISGMNLAVTALAALALYGPFDIAGIVASTAIATAASVLAQVIMLRRELGRLEITRLLRTTALVGAGSAVLAGVAFGVWLGLDELLGRAIWAQVISMGAALAVGGAAYFAAITLMRVPEAQQLRALISRRRAAA